MRNLYFWVEFGLSAILSGFGVSFFCGFRDARKYKSDDEWVRKHPKTFFGNWVRYQRDKLYETVGNDWRALFVKFIGAGIGLFFPMLLLSCYAPLYEQGWPRGALSVCLILAVAIMRLTDLL